MTEAVGKLHVIYDNVSLVRGLEADWGFSCLVEWPDVCLLFDTGADGRMLLRNMQGLGLDIRRVGPVVLSHGHGDHTGGLQQVLEAGKGVTVYAPPSFPGWFRKRVESLDVKCENTLSSAEILRGVHITEKMGNGIREQALVLCTVEGLVVITGCAHPGVERIAAWAAERFQDRIYLLIGGFHLMGSSPQAVRAISERLESLGVDRIAPGHCTGDGAKAIMTEYFGRRGITCGVGLSISLPALRGV